MKPKFIALAGGVVMVVGSVLPWATVESFLGNLTINGTEGDGILSLVCGVIVAILAFIAKETAGARVSIPAVVVGVIGAFFAINAMIGISGAVGSEELSGLVTASAGIGIFVTILGAVLAVAGGLMRNPAAAMTNP